MNVLLWHGWVLEGSGSNVATARIADVYRRQGHDVTLVSQEPHPERYPWIDAWGHADAQGVSIEERRPSPDDAGRCTALSPRIGSLLPVFVIDEYEGFAEVKRFVDCTDDELDGYLRANVEALRAVAAWRRPDVVVAGHALPGPVVARRALGDGFVAWIHGSDLEYAVREQLRCRDLAGEGLGGARAVAGPSEDALRRCEELVPEAAGRTIVVSPGVDVAIFHPRPRVDAFVETAGALEEDLGRRAGRPAALDEATRAALAERDAGELGRLARTYDQTVPDPDSPLRLRELAEFDGPVVGYLGKFIFQKGVHHLLAGLAVLGKHAPRAVLIGFGLQREWLAALTFAFDRGDVGAVRWWEEATGERLGLDDPAIEGAGGLADRVTFTGRLDHRFAPAALASLDVLVVPSILAEAFGMVAAEGAAAGALPLVARHSGLAEVASALEAKTGRPGVFSYEPGADAPRRIAEGIGRLIALPPEERQHLREVAVGFTRREWTWDRTAERLLEAARAPGGRPPAGS
jgi:glycosyltransferase involved in cell wall biosynthesis